MDNLPGIACCCLDGNRTGETNTLVTHSHCLIYVCPNIRFGLRRERDESV